MNSKFTQIVRIMLGLILIVFGVNKIYSFIPLPQPPQAAADFMSSMSDTGYILTVVAIFEIVIGLMLIFRIWVPFALLLLVPISVNILLFHLFLDIPAIGTALLVVVLNAILLYKHRVKYKPLFVS
ncbi:DoxX family membrane protein [Flavobacterium cerinum]|uniref:DoxX family membrane protein n=1 Tax=Flavobacterium cerinum TaxID=2502784 RepID=A0A444H8L3_9FLAO|nr:DoxX family membrane protein [Flavobacterium cerinum]RWW99562.1 DoxX family membrane protein [Flavobacterium cerinum]